MKALQWTMTIPKAKETAFLKWFDKIAGPIFRGFGAVKHELYRVEDKQITKRQVVEEGRFIERVYFNDGFNIQSFFDRVKADPEVWEQSRKFESEFGATKIELRVINDVYGKTLI